MLVHHGDMHHVFPRNYLKKRGYAQGKYNQVANFVVVQQEINIKIGDAPPDVYLEQVMAQCESGEAVFGVIADQDALRENLAANCLPEDLGLYDLTRYEDFLEQRRGLMAAKMRGYYEGL